MLLTTHHISKILSKYINAKHNLKISVLKQINDTKITLKVSIIFLFYYGVLTIVQHIGVFPKSKNLASQQRF